MVVLKVMQPCGMRGYYSRRYLKGMLSLGSTAGPVYKIIVGVYRAARHEAFIVLLSLHYFLLCFTSCSYLDSMLSPFIILKCFKID